LSILREHGPLAALTIDQVPNQHQFYQRTSNDG
jgi:hypothetical protein